MPGRMVNNFPGFYLTPLGGGGGGTVSTPTGTVDGSNTSFTAADTPLFVVSDGIVYFESNGYTLSGLVITMTSPPVLYIRILS